MIMLSDCLGQLCGALLKLVSRQMDSEEKVINLFIDFKLGKKVCVLVNLC